MAINPNLVGTLYAAKGTSDAEDFDVSVDFSNWLTTSDTVSSGTVKCYYGTTDVSATMIGTVSDDNDDQVTFQFLANGATAGRKYRIEVAAVTAAGDTWLAYIDVVVN